MLRPAWAQAEARAILLAVLATVAGADELPPTRPVADLLAALPPQALCHQPSLSLDRVVVDGNYPWTPDRTPSLLESGTQAATGPSFPGADSLDSTGDPGLPDRPRHTLEIHAGSHWQVWLLEQTASGPAARLLLARR